MLKRKGSVLVVEWCVILLTFWISSSIVHADAEGGVRGVVKKEERWPVVSTEYGDISAVRVSDGINGSYLLHFFALEPNSVLLPLVLNADMLFYVKAGNGWVSWTEEEEVKHSELRQGDVHRLLRGTVLYIRSGTEQGRLRIHAIFPNSIDDLREPATAPYSSIQEMVLGFNKTILQATFKVSEKVIDEVLGGAKPAAITRVDELVLEMNKKKDKGKGKEQYRKLFNVLEAKKEIENCNGWSTMVTRKQLPALEGSSIDLVVVNLTAGSMMGPHWNTMDSEIVVILEGRGMVRVVSSLSSVSKENLRLEVEEGDVFGVPKFQPMAQMSFNNGTFVFMGFSRVTERNKPQFLATSILQTLNKQVLQIAFNIKRETLDELLAPQHDSIISACTSCAEQEMQIMEEQGRGKGKHGGEEEEEEEEEEGGWRRGRATTPKSSLQSRDYKNPQK